MDVSVKTILAAGVTQGTSGVAEAGRRAIKVLESAGYQVETGGLEKSRPPVDLFISLANADLTAKVFLENRPDKRSKSHIGFWAWELEHFPGYLAHASKLVDEIWANSLFAANSIARMTRTPIRVFPIPSVPLTPKYKAQPSRVKIFAFAFDFRSDFRRKNPAGAVAAFLEAFGSSREVELQIKISNASEFPKEYSALMRQVADRPNIKVFEQRFTAEEMLSWMTNAHTYISLHRSEGLGLNIMDSMARGVPTVTTAYSANLEFQSPDDSMLVPYELVPVSEYGPWKVNSHWAQPNVQVAAENLRVLATYPGIWRNYSVASRDRAEKSFAPDACVEILSKGWSTIDSK
jgi:glycosyltransferase involved in cell wall biosynthesis